MQESATLLEPNIGLMIVTVVAIAAAFAIPIYLAVRFLRAYERRSAIASSPDPTPASVDALQSDVTLLRGEVADLKRAQEFTTALIAKPPAQDVTQAREQDR